MGHCRRSESGPSVPPCPQGVKTPDARMPQVRTRRVPRRERPWHPRVLGHTGAVPVRSEQEHPSTSEPEPVAAVHCGWGLRSVPAIHHIHRGSHPAVLSASRTRVRDLRCTVVGPSMLVVRDPQCIPTGPAAHGSGTRHVRASFKRFQNEEVKKSASWGRSDRVVARGGRSSSTRRGVRPAWWDLRGMKAVILSSRSNGTPGVRISRSIPLGRRWDPACMDGHVRGLDR